MFDKAFLLKRVKYFYNDGPLLKELKKTFGEGDIDVKSGGFKCLLLVVTMNRSTDSPWPISNNPNARYNNATRPDCNLRIPLYQLVRASTAAPAYFRPETLQWDPNDSEKTFVFVDGGVTPYNNPSFLMYRMATQRPYGLNWKTGEKNLLIVSVGTGSAPSPGVYNNLLDTLKELPNNLMYAMQVDQDINCRTVGRCIFGSSIDRELGDMIPLDDNDKILSLDSDAARHFSYVRYNANLSEEGLQEMNLGHIDSDDVRQMDSVEFIGKLREVGKKVGEMQVKVKEHFKNFIANSSISTIFTLAFCSLATLIMCSVPPPPSPAFPSHKARRVIFSPPFFSAEFNIQIFALSQTLFVSSALAPGKKNARASFLLIFQNAPPIPTRQTIQRLS